MQEHSTTLPPEIPYGFCHCGCGQPVKSPDCKWRSGHNTNKRQKTLEQRFWEKVNKTDDCWLWTGANVNDGYGYFWAQGKLQRATHVSWEMVNGPIPDNMWVLHKCDVPSCVRPDHLFLGDHADNMRDMVKKERNFHKTHPNTLARGDRNGARTHPETRRRGSANNMSKLTATDVLAIRQAYKPRSVSAHKLAKQYGVTPSAIYRIIWRDNWKHI